MRIKLLKGMVVNKQPCDEGSEVDVSPSEGKQLIKSGRAVEVEAIREEAKAKRRGRPPKNQED